MYAYTCIKELFDQSIRNDTKNKNKKPDNRAYNYNYNA